MNFYLMELLLQSNFIRHNAGVSPAEHSGRPECGFLCRRLLHGHESEHNR